MLGTLITLLIAGVVGLVAISIVLAIVGVAFSLIGFLLFKVAPLLLVGWVVLKLVDRARSRRSITAADQRWLDS